jgi:hypothetical protein
MTDEKIKKSLDYSKIIDDLIDKDINFVDQFLEDNIKYANEMDKIEFLTSEIKQVNAQDILHLNKIVDRPEIVCKFAKVFKNIDIALRIEAGIFEFTLIYTFTKNYLTTLMPAIYNDKVNDLLANLDPNHPINNKTLTKSIVSKKINPQIVAFLRPQDLHPERWNEIIRKNKLREEKKQNIAVTDLYQCYKCKGRRCRMMEMQTRSSDRKFVRESTFMC